MMARKKRDKMARKKREKNQTARKDAATQQDSQAVTQQDQKKGMGKRLPCGRTSLRVLWKNSSDSMPLISTPLMMKILFRMCSMVSIFSFSIGMAFAEVEVEQNVDFTQVDKVPVTNSFLQKGAFGLSFLQKGANCSSEKSETQKKNSEKNEAPVKRNPERAKLSESTPQSRSKKESGLDREKITDKEVFFFFFLS